MEIVNLWNLRKMLLITSNYQKRTENPVSHLRWSFLRKQLTAKSR